MLYCIRHHFIHNVLIIILFPAIFGLMGFFYSFLGFVQNEKNVVFLEPFRSLTLQEIGGHFAFGFLAAVPSGNLRIALICGLMALTIDTDHILSVARVPVLARIDHSVLFAGLSSGIIGFLATLLITNTVSNRMTLFQSNEKEKITSEKKDKNGFGKHRSAAIFSPAAIFLQFFVITLTAFLSHIAYDTVIDENARFPLLAPFSFYLLVIPRVYGILIEAGAAILIYLFRSKHRIYI